MANIPDGTFRDWKTGDIMGEADYEQEREIIRTAINDNYSRVAKTYTQTQVDTKINDAVSGVQASKVVETGTTFPTSPTEGQTFFKTDELELYVFSGTTWNKEVVSSGTTFPSSPQTGQLFFRTDEKVLYFYSGTTWEKSVTLSSLGGIPSTEKGAASGVATLDANGDVPVSQLDNVPTIYSYGNVSLSFTVNAGTTITHDITVVDKKLYDITLYNTFLTFDTNNTTSVWEDFWTPYNGATWNRVNVNDGTADLFELHTNDVFVRKIEKVNSTTIRLTIINENTTYNRSISQTLYYRAYN